MIFNGYRSWHACLIHIERVCDILPLQGANSYHAEIGMRVGYRMVYYCQPGFILASRRYTTVSTCQDNGGREPSWSSVTIPDCERKCCPKSPTAYPGLTYSSSLISGWNILFIFRICNLVRCCALPLGLVYTLVANRVIIAAVRTLQPSSVCSRGWIGCWYRVNSHGCLRWDRVWCTSVMVIYSFQVAVLPNR